MNKLYMIGLGGSIKGANIEVHDIQLAVASSLEQCIEEVKGRWYGDDLHLDSYTVVKDIDGYRVDFSDEGILGLYLVVYGGYKQGVIDEIHEYDFVIADSIHKAKKIGKSNIDKFPVMDHVDSVVDVFENTGIRFNLIQGNYSFKNNKTTHTFLKLK